MGPRHVSHYLNNVLANLASKQESAWIGVRAMTDIFDMATDRETLERERAIEALRSRRRDDQHSAEECQQCGSEIAPARRQALPGVSLCIGCAEAAEQQGRHRRG